MDRHPLFWPEASVALDQTLNDVEALLHHFFFYSVQLAQNSCKGRQHDNLQEGSIATVYCHRTEVLVGIGIQAGTEPHRDKSKGLLAIKKETFLQRDLTAC